MPEVSDGSRHVPARGLRSPRSRWTTASGTSCRSTMFADDRRRARPRAGRPRGRAADRPRGDLLGRLRPDACSWPAAATRTRWCGPASSWPSASWRSPPRSSSPAPATRSRWASSCCSPATTASARRRPTGSARTRSRSASPCRFFGVEICRQRLAPAHFHRAVINAEMYGPEEAVAAGFLDRVVPATELVATARGRSRRSSRSSTSTSTRRASSARATTRSRAVRAAIDADAAGVRLLPECRARSSARPSCATACCRSPSRCSPTTASPASPRARWPRAPRRRRRPSTSCSATRPASSARCSSRASASSAARFDALAESDDPRADLVARHRDAPEVRPRQPGAGRADVLAPVPRLRSRPVGAEGRRRHAARSSSAAYAAASRRASSRATRPTSRTSSCR